MLGKCAISPILPFVVVVDDDAVVLFHLFFKDLFIIIHKYTP